jgi:hypothetical protein
VLGASASICLHSVACMHVQYCVTSEVECVPEILQQ